MLEAHDVTFGYGGGSLVLDGVSLAVSPGERVALVAPSGAGKTTLCRILAGYEQPSKGTVTVDGSPLPRRGLCPVQLIGQHPELAFDPQLTLKASLEEAKGPTDDLRCRFGVQQHWLSRYPRELSGGELQRFAIVRALAARPRYLVADEMSTMLDAITQAQIWHELLRTTEEQGIGVVLVSHSPALTARVATRVVELPACNGIAKG